MAVTEAVTEYAASPDASFRRSDPASNVYYPNRLFPNGIPEIPQTPEVLVPEEVFIQRRNEQLEKEQEIAPESEILKLGAKRGSERWGIVEAINKRTNFVEKFARTREILEQNFARFKVVAHELGHARVVNYVGGRVAEISIIPQGAVRGFTRYFLPSVRNVIDFVSYRIACASGSRIAEEKIGEHDHSGCGGDDSQINAFADWGERLTRGLYSKFWFIRNGWNIASRAMSSYSHAELHRDSMVLLDKAPSSGSDKAA